MSICYSVQFDGLYSWIYPLSLAKFLILISWDGAGMMVGRLVGSGVKIIVFLKKLFANKFVL